MDKKYTNILVFMFLLALLPLVSSNENYTNMNDTFWNFTTIYNSEGVYNNGSLIIGNVNGSIDEVMLFNRSLSDYEIGSISNSTFSRFFPTGEMFFDNLNLGANGTFDLAIPSCQQLNGSNISFKFNNGIVRYLNSFCMFDNYIFKNSNNNANLTLILDSENYKFYSPIIYGNININIEDERIMANFSNIINAPLNILTNSSLLNTTLANSLCPYNSTIQNATFYMMNNETNFINNSISCKKNNQYSLIVINTDTNSKNVTANLSLTNGSIFYPYSSITNYLTGEVIPITNGIAQLGIMDSYQEGGVNNILYLTSEPPTYSNPQASQTQASKSTDFSLDVNDDIALEPNGYYIFSTDNSGTWENESLKYFTTTPEIIVNTKDLNSIIGTTVHYTWYLVDNEGLTTSTEIYSLITTQPIDCSNMTRAGFNLVMIFASLILLSFVSYFVWNGYKNGNITVGSMITLFITIIICIALWIASGQSLGSSCGTVG